MTNNNVFDHIMETLNNILQTKILVICLFLNVFTHSTVKVLHHTNLKNVYTLCIELYNYYVEKAYGIGWMNLNYKHLERNNVTNVRM